MPSVTIMAKKWNILTMGERETVVHVALREDTHRKKQLVRRLFSTKRVHRENVASVRMVSVQVFFPRFSAKHPCFFLGLYPVCFQNTGNSVLFKIISFSLINIIAME